MKNVELELLVADAQVGHISLVSTIEVVAIMLHHQISPTNWLTITTEQRNNSRRKANEAINEGLLFWDSEIQEKERTAMTSVLQDIADTIATDFREAVVDAEKNDMNTIKQLNREMNEAFLDYCNKDALLSSKSEQSVRTLMEIQELRDVNHTTYKRRIEALKEQMLVFEETKTPRMVTLPATGPDLKVVSK